MKSLTIFIILFSISNSNQLEKVSNTNNVYKDSIMQINKTESIIYNIGNLKILIFPSYIQLLHGSNYSMKFNFHDQRYGDKDFTLTSHQFYFYILEDWKEEIECYDYTPSINSPILKDMFHRNSKYHFQTESFKGLNISDFKKFSFFTNKKTSVGFYFGQIGASYGGGRIMIFNTEGDEFLEFKIKNCIHPKFDINSNNFPPNYKF